MKGRTKMNHIEATIADLEANAADLDQKIVSMNEEAIKMRQVADFLKQRLVPSATAPAEPPKTERQKQPKRPTRKRGSRKAFSKYKGVYKAPPLVDGTRRFRAALWVDGQNKNLGVFAIEEEAAAVAAEARGETELAQELRDIVEQKENNPDRPGAKPRQKRRRSHTGTVPENMESPLQVYYECMDCGTEHRGTKPEVCEGCGDKRFREFKEPMPT